MGVTAMATHFVARHPEEWPGHYNIACFEGRYGSVDAAFTALQRALDLDASAVRSYAPGDDDLTGLHDDPRWQEVIAS